MYGDTAVAVKDLSGVIAMGNSVMSGSVDAFFGVLIDRIGKVIVRNLDLELEFPKLMMNEFEWGCAIQKLTVDPYDSGKNSTWDISDPNFTPTLLDGAVPTIHQKFFTGSDTWEIRRKFPNSILFTAFQSAESFGAFVEAVTAAMIDSMTLSINNMSRTAINNFAAEKIKNANGVINIADLYNVSKEERNQRIEEYVERFRLQGSFDNPIKTYSHGMKQKITIMSALVHNPKLWILDEPLTGLDPESIFQVKEAMKKHAQEGNIVFFSSHIIDVVERICDRIGIIKKRHILCQHSVKELEEAGLQLESFYMDRIENTDVDSDPVTESKTTETASESETANENEVANETAGA
jgi:ABC-type Na+ transport system ATPase subunit NatA